MVAFMDLTGLDLVLFSGAFPDRLAKQPEPWNCHFPALVYSGQQRPLDDCRLSVGGGTNVWDSSSGCWDLQCKPAGTGQEKPDTGLLRLHTYFTCTPGMPCMLYAF